MPNRFVLPALFLTQMHSIAAVQMRRMKDELWMPCILVENKIDLVEEREVPEGFGERAAKALGSLIVRYFTATCHLPVSVVLFDGDECLAERVPRPAREWKR